MVLQLKTYLWFCNPVSGSNKTRNTNANPSCHGFVEDRACENKVNLIIELFFLSEPVLKGLFQGRFETCVLEVIAHFLVKCRITGSIPHLVFCPH